MQGPTFLFPSLSLSQLGELSVVVQGHPILALVDTGATLSVLDPCKFPTPLPRSNDSLLVVGVSNKPLRAFRTNPLSVILGQDHFQHTFLLVPGAPCHLLGRDILSFLSALLSFTPTGFQLEHRSPSPVLVTALSLLPQSDIPAPSDEELALAEVPPQLWATDHTDIGRISTAVPIEVQIDPSRPLPCLRQYPLPHAAIEGARPLLQAFLSKGLIVPCTSPCNTPIFPIKKPGNRGWRLVQDLRAVNAIVLPRSPVVPNPHTLLSLIPPSATVFTAVDLCSAFFSIPVHPSSQYLFAFTWEGRQYTWTVLPQGFTESPSYFCQALHDNLASLVLPHCSVLLQYVDDLLLCSPDLTSGRDDAITLLTFLALNGHKASRDKLQFCRASVKFLGHVISKGSVSLDPSRIRAIRDFPLPTSKRQLRAFLGLAGYYRSWIPEFSVLSRPLYEALRHQNPDPLCLSKEQHLAIESIKASLSQPPALGLPNYSLPFVLFAMDKGGNAVGVLAQKHGERYRPVGYYSKQLDAVARALPPCLRSVIAITEIFKQSEDIILDSRLASDAFCTPCG